VAQTTHNDQTIIRYLLNELPDAEQVSFEDEYLEDEALFEQVRAVEEELIEDYVKGALSPNERRLFERHYLASEQRRARIQTARQLLHLFSANSSADRWTADRFFSLSSWLSTLRRQRLAFGFGVAAACLLLIGSGLGIELLRLRERLVVGREERASLERRAEESERLLDDKNEQLARERRENNDLREKLGSVKSPASPLPETAPPPPADDQIAYLVLSPGIRDINKTDKADVSADTRVLELRIILERQEKPSSFRAVVKTIEGNSEIWKGEGIKLRKSRSAHYLVIDVPADRFREAKAQDFVLSVAAPSAGRNGYEEIESYYFQVITK